MSLLEFAGCFPEEDHLRDELRAMLSTPLPAKVPNSITMPCSGCEIELSVGPRLTALMQEKPHIKPICPWCLVKEARERPGGMTKAVSLGNPDSAYECDCGTVVKMGIRHCPDCGTAMPEMEH